MENVFQKNKNLLTTFFCFVTKRKEVRGVASLQNAFHFEHKIERLSRESESFHPILFAFFVLKSLFLFLFIVLNLDWTSSLYGWWQNVTFCNSLNFRKFDIPRVLTTCQLHNPHTTFITYVNQISPLTSFQSVHKHPAYTLTRAIIAQETSPYIHSLLVTVIAS